MGRLIDADFLISYIEEELALKYTGHLSDDVVCGMISRQNEIIQFIKAQPTAFNVEEVVEKLEELKGQAFLTLANTDHAVFDFAYNQVLAYLDRAIEILKGGVK